MPTTPHRDSIDTIGLMVVKHALEPDPKAECVGHTRFHVVESRHEILDGETVGELLARLGLDEGDRVEIRFPTLAEDQAKLAAALAATMLPAGGSLRAWYDDALGTPLADPSDHTNERPTARRDVHGRLLDPVRWEHWPEVEPR